MSFELTPDILFKSAFDVIGLPFVGTNEDGAFTELWQTFWQRRMEIPHWQYAQAAYGIIQSFDAKSGTLTYLTGIDVPPDTSPPPGMEKWHIPAQTYAVFPCTLPTLMQTVQAIYRLWLPQSRYRRADGPEFERYDANFDIADPESVVWLYIPVEEKSDGV